MTMPADAIDKGQGLFSISQLQIAQGSQFIAVMSDAMGFATGGTTNLLTVGSSKGGTCVTNDPGGSILSSL